jgi:hypothetical protein
MIEYVTSLEDELFQKIKMVDQHRLDPSFSGYNILQRSLLQVCSKEDLVVANIFFATDPEAECSRSRISLRKEKTRKFFHRTDRAQKEIA